MPDMIRKGKPSIFDVVVGLVAESHQRPWIMAIDATINAACDGRSGRLDGDQADSLAGTISG